MTDILGPANAANAVTARPGDTRVFAALDSWFRDCTSDTVDDGTDITASWLNGMTAALRAMWRANGLMNDGATPIVPESGVDDNGIAKAVLHLLQRGQPMFGTDTSGAANVITATLTPAPPELKKGMRVTLLCANTSSGATVLNLNGLGNKAVTRRDGSALLDGDIVAGGMHDFEYDGTKWQMPAAWGRPRLIRNTTIYVNSAIGNDANDGTANNAQHALATVQGAINLAWSYQASAYTITIVIAPGTYSGAITPNYSGPGIVIDGQVAANVIVDGSFGPNVSSSQSIVIQGPNAATVKNLTVQNAGGAGAGGAIMAAQGATITTQNTASNACGGGVFEAYQGGTINVGSHTFKGSCYAFWYSLFGAIQLLQNAVFTISAPITVGIATAFCSAGGNLAIPGTSVPTFVNAGYVTGAKYYLVSGGNIASSGNGTNYLPGSIAGSAAPGYYL